MAFVENPLNPKGTPDSEKAAPVFPGGYADNALNPRGVPSNITTGTPDAQATDAQKVQDGVPKRAALTPTQTGPNERTSAGQNRQPPNEILP